MRRGALFAGHADSAEAWLTRFYSLGCSPVTAPLLREPAFAVMLERQGLRYCPDDTPWPIEPRPG